MVRFAALCLAGCLATQGVPVRFYASAAQPLRLTYVDTRLGKPVDWQLDSLNRLLLGRDGQCAVAGEGCLTLFADGRRTGDLRRPEPNLTALGWAGAKLLFTATAFLPGGEMTRPWLWDPRSGQVSSSPLPDDVLHGQTVADGYLAMRRLDPGGSLVLYGLDLRPRREWRITSGESLNWRCLLGQRYAVMEWRADDQSNYLWVVDLTSERSQRVADAGHGVCCPGRTDHELITVAYTDFRNDQTWCDTAVWALDVEVRRRVLLFETKDQFTPVGLSDDRVWLLGLVPFGKHGPQRLVAVRLADGHRQTIMDDVYDCVVLPPDSARASASP